MFSWYTYSELSAGEGGGGGGGKGGGGGGDGRREEEEEEWLDEQEKWEEEQEAEQDTEEDTEEPEEPDVFREQTYKQSIQTTRRQFTKRWKRRTRPRKHVTNELRNVRVKLKRSAFEAGLLQR
jgi:hypothetical protein